MVHVRDADGEEDFMVMPRPNARLGRAWVVRHQGHDIWMYRSPDLEDVPTTIVFRYEIHECWLSDNGR